MRSMSRNLSTAIIFIVFVFSATTLAYPGGVTGRTKKTSTTGCSCHTNNSAITGTITGPDTVTTGTSATYTITVSRSGYSGAHGGVDISTRLGVLAVLDNRLKLQSAELTQQAALTFASGTVSVTFTYTAPSTAGTDTLWNTVAAGYSNGWNWGTEKRIIVRAPLGVTENQTPVQFVLQQNYPNPFNPSTTITFELPKTSEVSLMIYDTEGKIAGEMTGTFTQGTHDFIWNASEMASGIYYYILKANEFASTKKMILIK